MCPRPPAVLTGVLTAAIFLCPAVTFADPAPAPAPAPGSDGATTTAATTPTTTVTTRAPAAPAGPAAARVDGLLKGALQYLAAAQNADGSWFVAPGRKAGSSVAATAYALLAYVAAGNTHQQGDYAKNVAAGVKFLLGAMDERGFIQAGRSIMYDQGIATEVLAELLAQTRDPALRGPVEKAVGLIAKTQGPDGGWRYGPTRQPGDVSVVGFEIPALVAASKAGVKVDEAVLKKAIEFVRQCQYKNGGFTYMPHSGDTGYARTASAVHSLLLAGLKDDPATQAGLKYLRENRENDTWLPYARLYAAAVRQMVGGEEAERGSADLAARLEASARRDGEAVHWDSGRAVLGETYATAIYAAVLALPRGHLTIYAK